MSVAPAIAAAALADAKAYLRLDTADEDALLGTLIDAAAALCEGFTGLALWLVDRSDTVGAARPEWQRLPATPVGAIGAVSTLDPAGIVATLPPDAYATTIDSHGDGWVRLTRPVATARLLVGYQAGLAADWPSLPAPLRQGIVRLVAHIFAHRDASDDAGPPAAVAALWRPWRRMRLA
ncbi:head-tail connector protein [uncultured Sphingomonas sp.]|uniref:head-tail connector protein n=1 Tax=uncultured Sphingomonas sp. TaxID=158754 RepID=UPI00261675DD|nr:head-tail connector protein [uncultured Sphingomonas sp.]